MFFVQYMTKSTARTATVALEVGDLRTDLDGMAVNVNVILRGPQSILSCSPGVGDYCPFSLLGEYYWHENSRHHRRVKQPEQIRQQSREGFPRAGPQGLPGQSQRA